MAPWHVFETIENENITLAVQSPTAATIKPGLLGNSAHLRGQRSFLVVTVSMLAGLIPSASHANPMNTLFPNQNKHTSRNGVQCQVVTDNNSFTVEMVVNILVTKSRYYCILTVFESRTHCDMT